ncbi:HU domain-containing protein [Pedobacter montanisoli]|uniref:SPOR domain-containing protein n=1 Tax=Pedobacter montanisoli TaxID=2923277 RepID=A0ABT0A052_9SPHI|nr:hypothetical protein [Pedobacter montanisoli]MCJ0743928.1 hypothetical protein [Pedobacter montanisoli]
MDILQYLLELLQSHKEVGIDGLGTIYKQKKPGRYDVDTHMFLPPSYILAFTTEIKEDENLLSYVTAKRNISVDSAKYFIAQFVNDIHKELEQKGEFKLEGIGKLSNQNGSLSFSPESSVNTGFDYYALPAVSENASAPDTEEHIPAPLPVEEKTDTSLSEENSIPTETEQASEEVKSEETAHTVNDIPEQREEPVNEALSAENIPAQEEIFEEISEAPLTTQTKTETQSEGFNNQIETVEKSYDEVENELANDFDKAFEQRQSGTDYTEDEPVKSGSGLKIFFIILLVLLLLGAIAYFVRPDLFNFSKNNKPVGTLPAHQGKAVQTQADSLSLADSIMRAAHQAGLKVEPSKDTLKVTTQVKPLQLTTYEVIGAAFATQKEVDDFIHTMKNKGIDAKVIPAMPGKIYKKVSIASYSNIDSAKKDLKELRAKFKNPELYIFINEHK